MSVFRNYQCTLETFLVDPGDSIQKHLMRLLENRPTVLDHRFGFPLYEASLSLLLAFESDLARVLHHYTFPCRLDATLGVDPPLSFFLPRVATKMLAVSHSIYEVALSFPLCLLGVPFGYMSTLLAQHADSLPHAEAYAFLLVFR